jgi:hypothetical protein
MTLFSCNLFTDNKAEDQVLSVKNNDFLIGFASNRIFGNNLDRDTFQVYYIYNNSLDAIWIATVKDSGFESNLINKIYEKETFIKHSHKNQWARFTSDNSNGFGSIDSVLLSPKKVILFAMQKISKNDIDSMSYTVKIKVKHNTNYNDTLVRKKLRLYNNEKFIEDTAYWPAIENTLNKK